MPQSPLSKAVNTEFPRHTAHPKSTLGSVKNPVVEINEKDAGGGDNDALWQLVHSLECEGSRASLCAKTVIAANTKYDSLPLSLPRMMFGSLKFVRCNSFLCTGRRNGSVDGYCILDWRRRSVRACKVVCFEFQ